MKRAISIILITIIAALPLAACSKQPATQSSGKLTIISTVFPGYDFAKQVAGEYADVTILVPPGSESHSYEPTPKDIISIEKCDLFIYVGGLSDNWVDSILASSETKAATVKMMDCVSVYEEELVAGMTPENEEHGEEEGPEYDEHVWTSPKNAILITKVIADKLKEIDAANADKYTANCDAYVAKIDAVDKDFDEFFNSLDKRVMVFGDRFPLRYFAEEYKIEYYAAFPGCSSETEPSAATIAFLIDVVKTEKISTVFYIEFSNHVVADSIAAATGAKTALFHTCHNVSKQDIDAGATYCSLMEQNLATLKEAMV